MPPTEDVLVRLIQARVLEGSVLGIPRADIHTLHVSVPVPSSTSTTETRSKYGFLHGNALYLFSLLDRIDSIT
jgi:hypothetical protein